MQINNYPDGVPKRTDQVPFISDPASVPELKLAAVSDFAGWVTTYRDTMTDLSNYVPQGDWTVENGYIRMQPSSGAYSYLTPQYTPQTAAARVSVDFWCPEGWGPDTRVGLIVLADNYTGGQPFGAFQYTDTARYIIEAHNSNELRSGFIDSYIDPFASTTLTVDVIGQTLSLHIAGQHAAVRTNYAFANASDPKIHIAGYGDNPIQFARLRIDQL